MSDRTEGGDEASAISEHSSENTEAPTSSEPSSEAIETPAAAPILPKGFATASNIPEPTPE
ncbi:hypothetical protein ACCT21_37405, partial [Rhizobium brockwellii]